LKFTIEITLGNDAMQQATHLAEALYDVSLVLREHLPSGEIRSIDGAPIRDENGNTVGRWEVSND
jgi:hypothetical protein